MRTKNKTSILNRALIIQAIKNSVIKLNPVLLIKNPVIFIVEIGALITSVIVITGLFQNEFSSFNLQISIWLWFTVLFANFSESIAEGKGKAQAANLRNSRIQSKQEN